MDGIACDSNLNVSWKRADEYQSTQTININPKNK